MDAEQRLARLFKTRFLASFQKDKTSEIVVAKTERRPQTTSRYKVLFRNLLQYVYFDFTKILLAKLAVLPMILRNSLHVELFLF